MGEPRFAGYRIMQFSDGVKDCLQEIAQRLVPVEDRILADWMQLQWDAWQPPGITRKELTDVFGDLMRGMLRRLEKREPEPCLVDLESAGAELARRKFPFEALVISIHFFEESYLPYLLEAARDDPRRWLIGIDEFLHAALASLATSYFDAYREELMDEAEIGRIVQTGLLAVIPRKVADLEIGHVYQSARERARLGGDFLDFFQTGSAANFIIGDLSGHGLEAAAESVMLRSLFKGFMREDPDPGEAMARLNRVLASELGEDQFATALAISYEPSGRVRMVNAGHPCPIVCDAQTCRVAELEGMALAVAEAPHYAIHDLDLQPGSVLVAYTDGLTEARNDGKLFGEGKLLGLLAELREAPARGIAEHMVDDALRFARGTFNDDVAVLVLKRLVSAGHD